MTASLPNRDEGRVDRRWLAAAAAAIVIGASAVFAQNQTFSSRVESVRVDVLVTDEGRPVPGLQPADFEIRDNGVTQQVDLVTFEQAPLNVVLVFDVSGSLMGDRLALLGGAAGAVADGLRPGDRAALVTFNSAVTVPVPLTDDVARVREAFARQASSSETALIDASYTGVLLAESDVARGLVIVFSDGADTASFLRPDAVVSTAKRADAVVYAVSAARSRPDAFLNDLTDATGGRVLTANANDLGTTFLAVFNEFRQRYLLSYTPRGVATAGWHELSVRLKAKRGAVRARRGYLAGPPFGPQ